MLKAAIVVIAMVVISWAFWIFAKSEAAKLSKEFGGSEDEGYEENPNDLDSFKHGQAY
jgi:hypothetical protein